MYSRRAVGRPSRAGARQAGWCRPHARGSAAGPTHLSQSIAGNEEEASGHAKGVGKLERGAALRRALLQAACAAGAVSQNALPLWRVHRLACTAGRGERGRRW